MNNQFSLDAPLNQLTNETTATALQPIVNPELLLTNRDQTGDRRPPVQPIPCTDCQSLTRQVSKLTDQNADLEYELTKARVSLKQAMEKNDSLEKQMRSQLNTQGKKLKEVEKSKEFLIGELVEESDWSRQDVENMIHLYHMGRKLNQIDDGTERDDQK